MTRCSASRAFPLLGCLALLAGPAAARPASRAELSAPDAWSDLGTDAAPLQGRMETLTLPSRVLGETVTVPVYLPPGHSPRWRGAILYAVPGQVFFAQPGVQLPRRLERLPAEERLQAVVVGIPGSSAEGWHHPDGAAGEAMLAHVLDELLPAVERRYAPHARREDRALLGFSSGANVALDWAVRRPERFGRAVLMSPGWMDRDAARNDVGRIFLPEALAHIRAAPRGRLPQVWVGWGDGTLAWERRSREHGRQVVAALQARGAHLVEAAPVEGEHGLHLVPRMLPGVLRFLAGRR